VSAGSTSWRARSARTIDDVGREAWLDLEAPSFYLSHDWLRTVEGMLSREHPYLVLERRGEVVGVMACQLLRDDDVYAFYNPQFLLLAPDRLSELQWWLSPDPAQRMAALATDLRPRAEQLLPALLATAPRGYRSGISYHRSLSLAERDEAAHRMVDAFEELAVTCGANTTAVIYLPEASDPHLEAALARRGFVPSVLGGDCSLHVSCRDFDGYLAHFRSGRRKTLLADIRRFVQAGCTAQVGGVELLDDDLAAMQAATQAKYGHPSDPARTARWFARVRSHLGPYTRVAIGRRGADVLGFGIYFEAGRELYGRAAGFDYDRLDRERSYFNVLYYEAIRYATAAGLRRIHYGMESYQAKLERGCTLEAMNGWFRFRTGDAERLTELLHLHTEAQRVQFETLRDRYGPPLPP
jgi:predicted N-acyltransferase